MSTEAAISRRLVPAAPAAATGVLALAIEGMAGLQARNGGAPRGPAVLVLAGIVSLLVLLIAIQSVVRPPEQKDVANARVVLLALMAQMLVFAACFSWLAFTRGEARFWLPIIPLPAWFVLAYYIPFVKDSPVLASESDPNKWTRILGYPLLYSDRESNALWVEFPGSTWGISISHTPNLGNRWGRTAMLVFLLMFASLIGAMFVA